jgi:hypothetical protein
MPLRGVRYRVTHTRRGPVRLAIRGQTVVEAKNLRTGAVHTPAEFAADRRGVRPRAGGAHGVVKRRPHGSGVFTDADLRRGYRTC